MKAFQLASIAVLGAVTGSAAMAASIDVVMFKDTFDVVHVEGDSLAPGNAVAPEIGWRYQDITGGLLALNTVTDAVSNPAGGLSWRQERNGTGGAGGLITRVDPGFGSNLTAPDRIYTLKFDFYLPQDEWNGPNIFLHTGGVPTGLSFLLQNKEWKRGAGQASGTLNDGDAWSNIEIEYTFVADALNPAAYTAVDYNFYITQDAYGDQPALNREKILDGTFALARNFGEALEFNFQMIANPSVVYYDNLEYGYSVVPEPTVMGLMGVAGITLLRRRRS